MKKIIQEELGTEGKGAEEVIEMYDLSEYKKAMEDYNRNPVSYSHEEVKRMLGVE